MDESQVAGYWDQNADAWTKLSRAGYNTSRDLLNTPAFLDLLGPAVPAQTGLDIGCGDGHLTRILAQRGLKMTGIDIAPTFVRHARDHESISPLGIDYVLGNAQQLPFADASFDLVTGMMSFMDMPRPDLAIAESFRALKPGGVLQFAITHPCFQTAKWAWVTDDDGRRTAVICGDYFAPPPDRLDVWIFGSAPREAKRDLPKFRIPRFDFTLSWWTNTILDAGFTLERMIEPVPDDELIAAYPDFYTNRIVAFFLHIRCRKPA
jgi:SAM-dependent methyltransferase